MSYGVTAYRVKWEYINKYVFGSNNKAILKSMDMTPKWHTDLTELFKGTKSIRPKKAAEDIISGVFSHTDSKSGSMYRYVLEKMLWRGQNLLYFKRGSEKPKEDAFNGNFLPISKKMDSREFYPISFDYVKHLFSDYDDIPISFPLQEDFPLTSFITLDKLEKLRLDYSSLNLSENCINELEKWVEEAIEFKQDIILFYC